ncbi:MAG: hypothetical protein JXC85_00775 [Candidatus Aenigmarchaeota archaeon]|nr:hypothetical protein [Candidatus Aenigmarchaeota archaeon]
MTEGYCVKCRERVDVDKEQEFVMKNGKKAIKGECSRCGTVVYVIKRSPKPNFW